MISPFNNKFWNFIN